MALKDFQSADTIARSKRGTTNRSLGAKPSAPTKVVEDRPGLAGQFGKKIADVTRQTADMAAGVTGATGRFVANTPRYIKEDFQPFLQGVARTITGELGRDLSNTARIQDELDRRMGTLSSQYKSGAMSRENYNRALKDLSAEYSELSKQAKTTASKADRGDVIESAAMTAFDILSVGQLQLGQVGGKQALQMGSKEGVKALVRVGANRLERQVLRMPVVRSLVERNLMSAAKRVGSETLGKYLAREGAHVAAGLLIKRPIFYQSNLGDARRAYEGMITGDYPQTLRSAAWLGIQLLDGGPLGAVSRGYGWTKGKLGKLAYGRESFIDGVSSQIGNGRSTQIAEYLDNLKNSRQRSITLYRGEGANLSNGNNMFGDALYAARGSDTASQFGKVKKVVVNLSEDEILKINSPEDYQSFVNRALQTYPGETAATALPKFGRSLGYKAIEASKQFDELGGIAVLDDAVINRARPVDYQEAVKVFRIFQEMNLRTTDNDVPTAVSNFLRTYTDAGIDLKRVTPAQLYSDMRNWQRADEIWNHAAKAGALRMSVEEAARYTPVRWDATVRDTVANLESWDQVQALADRPQSAFGNNNNLMLTLERIFKENAGDQDAIMRAVRAIDAAQVTPRYIPKRLSQRLAKLGYTMAEPVGGRAVPSIELNDTRKLVTGAINGSNDLFDEAIAPQPEMHAIARFFESVGVTPRDSNTFAYRELGKAVASRLDGTMAGRHFGFVGEGDQAKGGQAILSKLRQYVEDKPAVRGLGALSTGKSAVTDIRQLTIREIQDALGHADSGKWVKLGRDEAKEVARAIAKGYMDVPLELRGLGEKITDTLFAYNPAQKYYSRIQSALRYTYNPFFRVQERAETAILSRAQASNLIWNRGRAQLDDAVRILDENRIFSGVLPGEAAQDQVLGRITANLTRGQKRDLAGLAMDIADSRRIPLDELARDFPDEIDDALRVVVQYPRKGVLASPLARTMNLMFFPMRYNAKVTMLAAQTLAKQPPHIQKAVLHSGFQMREWLKSDEGIRWQSEHADAIQLFKWITPINSIESTFRLLTGPDGFGEVGLLGGLPLGFITQILDGQGIIDINKPYVDPKTGTVFPDYIPATTKARAATALGDLINTMFTYPGRILGLPGKEKTVRDLIKKIVETEGADFEKRLNDENLTPVQQAWVRVLKGDASEEALDALYTSPAPGQFNWYTLPPLDIPIRTPSKERAPIKRRKNLPKKSKTSRGPRTKKIAQPMPQR